MQALHATLFCEGYTINVEGICALDAENNERIVRALAIRVESTALSKKERACCLLATD